MPVNFELWTLLLLHVLLLIPTLCAVLQCNVSTGTKHLQLQRQLPWKQLP